MFEDVVKREIESELNTGKGCIVFEVGCALNSHYLEVFCDKMNLRSVGLLDNLVLHLSIDGKSSPIIVLITVVIRADYMRP